MAIATTVMAIPAKEGVTKLLTLVDGTTVKAQLVGDEYGHFWKAENGKTYLQMTESEVYREVDATQIVEKANARRVQVNARRSQRLGSRRVSIGEKTHYTGKKNGLVILMQFKDKSSTTAYISCGRAGMSRLLFAKGDTISRTPAASSSARLSSVR